MKKIWVHLGVNVWGGNSGREGDEHMYNLNFLKFLVFKDTNPYD